MTASTIKMTADQFLRFGEDSPGVRRELVDGEIAVSPSPSPDHSHVDTQLRTLLNAHVRKHDLGIVLGDVDTIFGPHDVRRPDVIYFHKARRHLISRRALDGAPDLCAEIISPSSVKIDRKDKFEQYAAGGVAYYWILDPEARTVEAFEPSGGKYRKVAGGSDNDVVHLPPFLDLSISLRDLWFPW